MFSVRLPEELERKVNQLAEQENRTKSQIFRNALEEYVAAHEKKRSSFELGEDLFGKYSSGREDLSQTYKKRIKEKLHGKKRNHSKCVQSI